jgi:hypothetical protein
MEETPSVPDHVTYSGLFDEVTNRPTRGRSYEDALYYVQLTDQLMMLIDEMERERVAHRRNTSTKKQFPE